MDLKEPVQQFAHQKVNPQSTNYVVNAIIDMETYLLPECQMCKLKGENTIKASTAKKLPTKWGTNTFAVYLLEKLLTTHLLLLGASITWWFQISNAVQKSCCVRDRFVVDSWKASASMQLKYHP